MTTAPAPVATARPTLRLAAAVLSGVALLICSCSTVPTDSLPVAITQVSEPEPAGFEPLSPEVGASPEEIVRGFIESTRSTTQGRPVSREYLTVSQAETWDDTVSITVIEPEFSAVTSGPETTVQVTGQRVGSVDRSGVFTPDIERFVSDLSLVQENEEWRISSPPPGIIITRTDFVAAYEQQDIFFLDGNESYVVPDPRFFLRGGVQATLLVERLIAGPNAWLAPAVSNPLGEVELASSVLVTGRTAAVELSQVGERSVQVLEAMSAQLAFTLLGQLSIQSLTVTIDGTPLQLPNVGGLQELSDWLGFDPDADTGAITGIGHYVDAGGVRTEDGTAVPGPAGTGVYALTSAAISIDEDSGELLSLAGLGIGPGQGATLYVGPYGGELVSVLSDSRLTAPTWSPLAEEVWTVRNGSDVVRVPSGGPLQAVSAPQLAGTGAVRVFQMSSGGAMAAVILETPTGPELFIARIERNADTITVGEARRIAPSLTGVIDVAWTSSDSLIVLATDPRDETVVPYTIGVDGWGITELTTDGLPGQPDSVAATPNRPYLVSAAGTVWQFSIDIWAVLIRGQPPLPGTAPFYPR